VGEGVKRAALRLLLPLTAGYLGILLLLTALQARLVFFPTRDLRATPADAGLVWEELRLRTEDGLGIHAWWVPAEGARGTILFCHGNAGNVGDRIGSILLFHRLGWNVLIFDYRGYGRSEGSPSEAGLYRDATAAWAHLTAERGVAPEDIVLFGRSLGGAVAAELAERHAPAGIILESAFTSVPELAAEFYPWLPVRLLVRFRFDTLARVPRIRAPLLVVHSRGDDIIPFRHGERLYRAAGEPKTLLEISGTHNEGFVASGERYERGLARFLEEVAGPAS
jgi:fermentation-respiration switch protein FrsA (DUF1100 family)